MLILVTAHFTNFNTLILVTELKFVEYSFYNKIEKMTVCGFRRIIYLLLDDNSIWKEFNDRCVFVEGSMLPIILNLVFPTKKGPQDPRPRAFPLHKYSQTIRGNNTVQNCRCLRLVTSAIVSPLWCLVRKMLLSLTSLLSFFLIS